jgi:hypothetical protein
MLAVAVVRSMHAMRQECSVQVAQWGCGARQSGNPEVDTGGRQKRTWTKRQFSQRVASQTNAGLPPISALAPCLFSNCSKHGCTLLSHVCTGCASL